MKQLLTFIFILLGTFELSAQEKLVPQRMLIERKSYGVNHISKVEYQQTNDSVFAHITIQHPVPAMSGCGAMCYRTTVKKWLNANVKKFKVIDERFAVAHDGSKMFIMGMEVMI